MIRFERILCPTDLSDPSFYALSQGVEMARHFGAELIVLYVVPTVPPILPGPGYSVFPVEGYEKALEEAAAPRLEAVARERIPPDVRARTLLRRGDAAAQILLVSDDDKADLIVIATHGMTGWHHFVFGSVTEKVVRLAHCPVLTLRQPRPPQ